MMFGQNALQQLMAGQQQRPGGFMPDPRLANRPDLFRGDMDTQIYQPQGVPTPGVNDQGMQMNPDDIMRALFWRPSQRTGS